ncbi:serine/threonine-protein kinase 31 [Rhinophrynus dorsalis]
MELDSAFNKVERVYVSHVEDPVTFWAQSMSRIHDISKLSDDLARVCPTMSTVFGVPDLDKIYGGLFSADKCWYRCKLQHAGNDEQCAVTYIDYGNSEMLNRSNIVELPEDLQFPAIAQKYRLWGLQLQGSTDLEQGIKFLSRLIADKQISVQQKATYKDGTIVVKVLHETLDVGEEMEKKGFAEKCRVVNSPNNLEEKSEFLVTSAKKAYPWMNRKLERPPMREPKSKPMLNKSPNNQNSTDPWMENYCGNNAPGTRLKSPENPGNCLRTDKLLDEIKQLKEEKEALLQKTRALESQFEGHGVLMVFIHILGISMTPYLDDLLLKAPSEKLLARHVQDSENADVLPSALPGTGIPGLDPTPGLPVARGCGGNGFDSMAFEPSILRRKAFSTEKEKRLSEEAIRDLEISLQSAIGSKLKSLASKIELLKTVRYVKISQFGGLPFLASPGGLSSYQAKLDELISSRDNVRKTLLSSVESFILEVDALPLDSRTAKLQTLLLSLESVYGKADDIKVKDDVYEEFFKWKQANTMKFTCARNDVNNAMEVLSEWLCGIRENMRSALWEDTFSVIRYGTQDDHFMSLKFFDLTSEVSFESSEVVGNIDDILNQVESDISKELELSLLEQDEADRIIITNVYSKVVESIHQELHLISLVRAKYLSSTEFKRSIVEWIDSSPNTDHLMSIKKTIKGLKAQLRWKLVERSSLEESDEYDETALAELKEEITVLRNSIFSEICREQDEYRTLSVLVQKWFPELPLIHPEAGILNFMNSGGLFSGSMERDLLDAEPMKELSSKRPLVRAEIQNKIVLLKGYSVGVDTEEKVIESAAKYHKAWSSTKEESGIMELIYLFFCKSDPLVYLMVPFFPDENLGTVQAKKCLSSKEIVKVMSGVAQGLHTLHSAGIIVGSLHENNVFAVNRQKGIVGDFDFTKDANQRNSVTSVLFPWLTAPELKLGQPASESSDMYAYGGILLWLCIRHKEFAVKEDGTPDLNQLDLNAKVKCLLSSLLCSGDRLKAEQVKAHEYFHMPEEVINLTDARWPERSLDSSCSGLACLLVHHGWILNMLKYSTVPFQELGFQGMRFDTRQGNVFLPQDKSLLVM